MRRLILFSLAAVLIFASTSVLAANIDRDTRIALKVDWLTFTDDMLEDTDSDTGLYYALDMRSPISEYYDIGMEIGYIKIQEDIIGPKTISGKSGIFSAGSTWENTITFIPIEVNLSYSRPFGNLVYTLGGGVSGNYIKYEVDVNDLGTPFTLVDDDKNWLLGAQAFFDFSYDSESYFFGVDAKYQFVKEHNFFDDWLEVNFSNFRTGLHVGRHF